MRPRMTLAARQSAARRMARLSACEQDACQRPRPRRGIAAVRALRPHECNLASPRVVRTSHCDGRGAERGTPVARQYGTRSTKEPIMPSLDTTNWILGVMAATQRGSVSDAARRRHLGGPTHRRTSRTRSPSVDAIRSHAPARAVQPGCPGWWTTSTRWPTASIASARKSSVPRAFAQGTLHLAGAEVERATRGVRLGVRCRRRRRASGGACGRRRPRRHPRAVLRGASTVWIVSRKKTRSRGSKRGREQRPGRRSAGARRPCLASGSLTYPTFGGPFTRRGGPESAGSAPSRWRAPAGCG